MPLPMRPSPMHPIFIGGFLSRVRQKFGRVVAAATQNRQGRTE